MQEIVELRVHGVHGTSPAAMLGVDEGDVRQVAGDNLTGVYRSAIEPAAAHAARAGSGTASLVWAAGCAAGGRVPSAATPSASRRW